jgi:hypothetical protein
MAGAVPHWTPAFAGEQLLTCLMDIYTNAFQGPWSVPE